MIAGQFPEFSPTTLRAPADALVDFVEDQRGVWSAWVSTRFERQHVCAPPRRRRRFCQWAQWLAWVGRHHELDVIDAGFAESEPFPLT